VDDGDGEDNERDRERVRARSQPGWGKDEGGGEARGGNHAVRGYF